VSSMNKALILGNLGRDAEIRTTAGGSTFASFSVATTEKWTGKDGDKQEQTEWHRIVWWSKQAQTLHPYLTKGKQVLVEGRIQTRQYEKDGQKQFSTNIVADRVTLLGGGSRAEQAEYVPPPSAAPSHVDDSDIPF